MWKHQGEASQTIHSVMPSAGHAGDTLRPHLPSLEFRRAETSDVMAAAAIRRRAILALASDRMSEGDAIRWAERTSPSQIADAIAQHPVWVATSGERMLGWVEASEDRVLRLFVEPSTSGEGLGTQLLEQAEWEVETAGHREVRLESIRHAVPFFERNGYRQVRAGQSATHPTLSKKLPASH